MSLFFINLDRDTQERYDLAKFLQFTDNFDPLTSDFLDKVKALPSGGNYKITDDDQRPDRASLRIYSDFQYWWILMFYNDMLGVEDFTRGKLIQYPRRDALEDFYFGLGLKQLRGTP